MYECYEINKRIITIRFAGRFSLVKLSDRLMEQCGIGQNEGHHMHVPQLPDLPNLVIIIIFSINKFGFSTYQTAEMTANTNSKYLNTNFINIVIN